MAPLGSGHGALDLRQIQNLPTSFAASEEEADPDEPPDSRTSTMERSSSDFGRASIAPREQKESLLTKALLTKLDTNLQQSNMTRGMSVLSNASAASSAELTNDTGITSPSRSNTPSPPLPMTAVHQLGVLHQDKLVLGPPAVAVHTKEPQAVENSPEDKVEAVLGRRRCLKFACGKKEEPKEQPKEEPKPVVKERPCALRFACPTRASSRPLTSRRPSPHPDIFKAKRDETPKPSSPAGGDTTPVLRRRLLIPVNKNNNTDDKADAKPFLDFGSSVNDDSDWTNEQTAHARKLTIGDLCAKDDKFRLLSDEIDAEAEDDVDENEEDDEEDDNEDDEDDEDEDEDDDEEEEEGFSGNDTDDEAGFAASDDSDAGSAYEFWAPARADVEHIRPAGERRMSQSSIDSVEPVDVPSFLGNTPRKPRKAKMLADVSDLPDSTDFVCGTLDEDRPLEEAFKHRLEERRRSKHVPTPQDIDPSFPEANSDDEGAPDGQDNSDELWIKNQLEYDDEEPRRRSQVDSSHRASPKRYHSPPPPKHRSPTRRTFNSPTPTHKHMRATQVSRSPSPPRRKSVAHVPHTPAPLHAPGFGLGLTRTKSLPRGTNPFTRKITDDGDAVSPRTIKRPVEEEEVTAKTVRRSAIDIVKGLEKKRKHRRDKLQQKHLRKEKPGQGAEKMRELGLEINQLRPKENAKTGPWILSI